MTNIKSNLFFKKTIMGGSEQQPVPNTQEQAQETQEQQKTPEQEISDRVDSLSGKIISLANIVNENAIQFKESDGSETTISVDKRHIDTLFVGKDGDFGKSPANYTGQETTFSLRNGSDTKGNEKEYKTYKIALDAYGKLSVNGKNIPNEKAQAFLDKIETNIGDFKEYQTNIKEQKQLKNKQKEQEEREKDNAVAEQMLASIDF